MRAVGHGGDGHVDDPAGRRALVERRARVAVGLALCDAAGFSLPTLELAGACQEAELVATGAPCGTMDQLSRSPEVATGRC